MNTRKFERRGLIITETLMVLLAVLWAVPIYYLIVTTLKSPAEATASPLALPSTINLQNYIDAWQKMEFPRAFANTLFITAMSVFLIVLLRQLAFGKWCSDEDDSGVAGTQRFLYHREYLFAFGLRFQGFFSRSNAERAWNGFKSGK